MNICSYIIASGALLNLAATSGAEPPIKDSSFEQEYHEEYALGSAAANDVRSIAIGKDGRVWAGAADGIHVLDAGKWSGPIGGVELGPVHSIAIDRAGKVWAGTWNGLVWISSSDLSVHPTEIKGTAIACVRACDTPAGGQEILAGGYSGIWRISAQEKVTRVFGSWQTNIRALRLDSAGEVWVGTASGLYHVPNDVKPQLGAGSIRYSHPNAIQSSNITGFATLPDGKFAISNTGGIDFYSGKTRIGTLSAKDGMPYRNARSIFCDARERLWCATPIGVVRYDHGKWSLRHSRRWLLSDDTRDVAVDANGTAWVATAAGVDAIRVKAMTLSQKAAYFLENLRKRHIREPGLIGPAVLVTPGDLSKSFIEDDDNDGEHTGMYLAMESMRYAVTHDPAARANAKVAFHALMALQRATGTNHFIARSIVPIDGPLPRHEVDRTYTPREIAEMHRTEPREKVIEKRWLPTADGKWKWKRDASSDEVDGHMFGYATYFDLAADEDEKKLVADQVDRIIGGIVDHGYLLTDIDGRGTQWGNWSPTSLLNDPNWHEEAAGNAVEMISYLGVAYHMTHKPKYIDSANLLIKKYGYDTLMTRTVFDTPSERTHIEDELLTITYPNLINHLIFPNLMSKAQLSIQNWHKGCERDGIPFYDFVYNRYSGKTVALDRAVEQLRDWPLSHIEWTVDNSRREDVKRDLTPGVDDGALNRLVPRSEMGLCMFDQEPYKVVIGNGGQREDRQNDWLLAYWMGRYFGLLGGEE
jgi:hypothetical protein